jgi:hypothetical protein
MNKVDNKAKLKRELSDYENSKPKLSFVMHRAHGVHMQHRQHRIYRRAR